jgi:hypothetical protein
LRHLPPTNTYMTPQGESAARNSANGRRLVAHGPTSALFESHDHGYMASPSIQLSESSLKETATARAAEERHMEILNLASGKLDCEHISIGPTLVTDE